MSKKKGKLPDSWRDWSKKVGNKVNPTSLEFDYGEDTSTRRLIANALTFWRYLQTMILWDGESNADNWHKRRDALLPFFNHKNRFIAIIAKLESLPTKVWRKVLWKHNIDFMSFESFLRRLDDDQTSAIINTYNFLYEAGSVPMIFSKWNIFWGGLTVEKLFAENFVGKDRYCNKAAMSYNLLGLDFGFNAYPKGVNDDTRVVEISPLRFLWIIRNLTMI